MSTSQSKLEEVALEQAREAVEADQKGLRTVALQKYQEAVDNLVKAVKRYPDSPFKSTYLKRVREYRQRINFLKGMMAEDAKSGASFGRSETGQSQGQDQDDLSFRPYKSSITWDDAVGLEDIKKSIRQALVYPTVRPDLFPLGWPRGILLYGPPGCGKTTIAAAVSNEINGYFYAIDAASIMSKWLGEGEKNVAKLFTQMRNTADNGKPTVLFIDEVDSLLGVRQQEVGGEVRVRNQFLKEMDGLSDKSNKKLPLYVIASTNKPWALDWGFIRRFQRRIYVPMADHDMREKLFRHFLEGVDLEPSVDFRDLATATKGYTPSDIKDVCQTAVIEVVTELFENDEARDESSEPRPVGMRDLKDAIRRMRPSVSEDMKQAYDSWAEKFNAF